MTRSTMVYRTDVCVSVVPPDERNGEKHAALNPDSIWRQIDVVSCCILTEIPASGRISVGESDQESRFCAEKNRDGETVAV